MEGSLALGTKNAQPAVEHLPAEAMTGFGARRPILAVLRVLCGVGRIWGAPRRGTQAEGVERHPPIALLHRLIGLVFQPLADLFSVRDWFRDHETPFPRRGERNLGNDIDIDS